MNIAEYLDEVRLKYASGQATEHSYRPALEQLFASIDPTLTVINEPKRSDAGMPDFLFQRGDIPVGWCEAKDIDKDVIKLKGYSIEQRKRYEKAYSNPIYTNGAHVNHTAGRTGGVAIERNNSGTLNPMSPRVEMSGHLSA